MTVSSISRVAGPYSGNDSTVEFPFSFKVFSKSDLLVVLTDDEGIEQELVLDSGYSATLNADQDAAPGGTVTLPSALVTGQKLTITSGIEALQGANIQSLGGFYPSVINTALDRLTILIQQALNSIGRSVKLPISDGENSITLPTAAARAGKALGFDSSGLPIPLTAGSAVTDSGAVVHGATTVKATLDGISPAVSALSLPSWSAAAIAGTPLVVVITGQSNAVGVRTGGPNPASAKVKTWDGITGAWGGSDINGYPWRRVQPDGNSQDGGETGCNNTALSFAHRLADETGRPVYVIFDAYSGQPISQWVGSGTSSVRYAAIKAKVVAALASPELASKGITKIDYLLWAQGEDNALTDDFASYAAQFSTLDTQFRAESWMTDKTPMLVMGMSGLHNRYQIWQAQLNHCENINRHCIYVNSAGLKTQFEIDGTGDYTHWLGASLWELGYYRAYDALTDRGISHRASPVPFYSRGNGAWAGQADAIALFDNLVGYSCRTGGVGLTDTFTGDGSTTAFTLTLDGVVSSVTVAGVASTSWTQSSPTLTFSSAPANGAAIVVTYSQAINGPAATGSISWGYRCNADGNYNMAGGYLSSVNNTANYDLLWGRSLTAISGASYGGGFGYQSQLNSTYQFFAGRGHSPADSGGAAVGLFSKYTTAQTDNVIFQAGIGTSTSVRKNGFAVRKSGIVEIDNLPVYADNAAATSGGLLAGQCYRTSTGVLMVRY